jgi:glycosyltransferase involved in cell wall biosynthesis
MGDIDLSVVISAHNEERHLEEQLLAVQTQGIRPREIVLIDDASTDKTLTIMRQFASAIRGAQVRIIHRWRCLGAIASYNAGVAVTTSAHVYLASANDVLQSGAFAVVEQALQMFPGADLIVGNVVGSEVSWADRPTYIVGQYVAPRFGHQGIIHGAGVAVSRRAWDSVGGWQEGVGPYCDALMWHILALRHGLVYTPRPISWVRPNGPGEGYGGAMVLDRVRRRPYLEEFARRVLALEEPTRSRLVDSNLWSIREFAPDMVALLAAGVVLT